MSKDLMLSRCCGVNARKNGRAKNGSQRFLCSKCSRTFSDSRKGNNYLSNDSQLIIKWLRSSGHSTRQIVSITGFSKYTVGKYGKGSEPEKCECGKMFGHYGWCSFRYAQSAKRQLALHGTAKTDASMYFARFCDDCRKPLVWGGRRCKDCYSANAARKREARLADEPRRVEEQEQRLERRKLKLWNQLIQKLRMALRESDVQALQSLQVEFIQARTSLT